MSKTQEALKLALEALEKSNDLVLKAYNDNKKPKDLYNQLYAHREAITALRQALEQQHPAGEPVAWIVEDQHGERLEWAGDVPGCMGLPTFPLYTHPQPAAPEMPEGWKLVPAEALTRWRDAFAEELGAWDIDPPLHHIKTSHDEIDAMLSAAPEQKGS